MYNVSKNFYMKQERKTYFSPYIPPVKGEEAENFICINTQASLIIEEYRLPPPLSFPSP